MSGTGVRVQKKRNSFYFNDLTGDQWRFWGMKRPPGEAARERGLIIALSNLVVIRDAGIHRHCALGATAAPLKGVEDVLHPIIEVVNAECSASKIKFD